MSFIKFFIFLFCTSSFAFAQPFNIPKPQALPLHCKTNAFPQLTEFQKMGATLTDTEQTDFGRIKKTTGCYLQASPNTTQKVVALVKLAYENNIPIRTQGAAHSQNGSALPKSGELLIQTTHLNQLSFDHIDRVTAGGGIPIGLIKVLVSQASTFFLPVANDGGPGPTIGGYISAGGISSTSANYGGIWEHIYEITLVTGEGKILTLRKNNPYFLYLFGAMGQLGIITEVKLNLLPTDAITMFYPLGQTIRVSYPVPNGIHWTKLNAEQPLYWFNLFVTTSLWKEAKNDLLHLEKKYPHALKYHTLYEWPIRYISATPPLLFDQNKSFVAVGIWGTPLKQKESVSEFNQLQKDFEALIQQKQYKRYIQAELTGSKEYYEKYFPNATFKRFKEIKTILDPKFLFNKGSVF